MIERILLQLFVFGEEEEDDEDVLALRGSEDTAELIKPSPKASNTVLNPVR